MLPGPQSARPGEDSPYKRITSSVMQEQQNKAFIKDTLSLPERGNLLHKLDDIVSQNSSAVAALQKKNRFAKVVPVRGIKNTLKLELLENMNKNISRLGGLGPVQNEVWEAKMSNRKKVQEYSKRNDEVNRLLYASSERASDKSSAGG